MTVLLAGLRPVLFIHYTLTKAITRALVMGELFNQQDVEEDP
uniref:Uncharacterized protein n=1 Tax=Picea sitchensis TaxID=3332 RepID=A0A6B9XQF3_PICSI|nr:hypothetical protein Q903MT_gene3801 [Picea sitchensis]